MMQRYAMSVRRCVKNTFIDVVSSRLSPVDASVAALLAREHVMLVGPYGVGKSTLARSLARCTGLEYFSRLMYRDMTFDDLFGPLDVPALMKGRHRRLWTRIVKAEVVFLDELVRARPNLLDSILSMMEERVVYDDATGEEVRVNLVTLVAASNEYPPPSLGAVASRFSAIVEVKPYVDKLVMVRALQIDAERVLGVQPEKRGGRREDYEAAARELAEYEMGVKLLDMGGPSVDLPTVVWDNLSKIIMYGVEAGYLTVRSLRQLPKMALALAATRGSVTAYSVVREALRLLPNMSWRPDGREALRRAIVESTGGAIEAIEAAEEIALSNPDEAINKLSSIREPKLAAIAARGAADEIMSWMTAQL